MKDKADRLCGTCGYGWCDGMLGGTPLPPCPTWQPSGTLRILRIYEERLEQPKEHPK